MTRPAGQRAVWQAGGVVMTGLPAELIRRCVEYLLGPTCIQLWRSRAGCRCALKTAVVPAGDLEDAQLAA